MPVESVGGLQTVPGWPAVYKMICEAIENKTFKIATLDILPHLELRKDFSGDIHFSLIPFGELKEVWVLQEAPETAVVLERAHVMLDTNAKREVIKARLQGDV